MTPWSETGAASGSSASKASSRLQLAFELVQEVPIRALGNDLLRARLYHVDFAQAQGIEADRVLRIVFAPFVVGKFTEGLSGIIVAIGEPAIDQLPRDLRRRLGAEIGGLQNG